MKKRTIITNGNTWQSIELSGDVIKEIAEDSGLSVAEVEQLAGLQTV